MSSEELLQKLKEDGVPIYSISRIDSINNCLHGAYRTYILKEKGQGNVYNVCGSAVHDCLEGIINGEKTKEDLLLCIQEELENLEILGIEFPKGRDGSDSIRDGWIANMTHFCNNYKKPEGTFKTEQLFVYKTKNNNYLQGYIDLQKINEDGSVDLYDYKTSSMYTGEEIKKHGRQLLIYVAGLRQAGYKVNTCAWNFLKYARVQYKQGDKWKSKVCERRKIGREIDKIVEKDLYKLHIDEVECDIILTTLRETNSFDCLPDVIKGNYEIQDCIKEYEITDEALQECEDYIDTTIEMWESLDSENAKLYTPKKLTKTLAHSNKEVLDTFFCVNLCDHYKKCPHIYDFLQQQQ